MFFVDTTSNRYLRDEQVDWVGLLGTHRGLDSCEKFIIIPFTTALELDIERV